MEILLDVINFTRVLKIIPEWRTYYDYIAVFIIYLSTPETLALKPLVSFVEVQNDKFNRKETAINVVPVNFKLLLQRMFNFGYSFNVNSAQ